ncbi:hydrolase, NUDIX family protein [Pseudooceanicola batsensis HTCC2597]|uniref:NAD(+) diphosphatase n=1 Tax=Pseudooceanicola batsensis (strain ATCC BAA-863 / DSM 15984 / KCTC 12145 / HTCC2597) TaxID=252305 RepID=A3TVM8_PSEBH|nr:NAD(+) diphosphatase [Pseudooceanicola batsensis]EAQ03674.1 hydrolase, NUDIX family protein [Pseudooceanicola batsensis HTCC2597]
MRHAEEVTFGGSGLDRAAELRGRDETLEAARRAPGSTCILFWRGFPLLAGESALARLPMDYPVLRDREKLPVLLGREDGGLVFAQDISEWSPPDAPADLGPGRPQQAPLPSHPEIEDGYHFGDLRGVMGRLNRRDAELAATGRALYSWHATHGFCARCGRPSRVTMAGWQRSCDSCGGQHFPRTDPVVIMLITHGNDLLLGRSPGWPDRMWSLLAGFVEPGETIEAAVRREVMEEARIPVGPVTYLSSQPWAFPNSLMFGCHGEATGREITLDPVELEDACWVPREEMVDVLAGTHTAIRPLRQGAIAEFLIRNWVADTLD